MLFFASHVFFFIADSKTYWQFPSLQIKITGKLLVTTKMGFDPFKALYSDESKALQYFGNVRHNTAAPDNFIGVMKVTNHTGL